MADSTKLLLYGGAAAAAYWWFYLRTPAPVDVSPVVVPVFPVTSPGTVPVVPAVVPVLNQNPITGDNSVSGIQARVILAAGAPAEGLGVDQWGYYLNDALSPLGKSAPDPMPLFQAASPGFDRSQKVTAAQYWPVMAAALRSQLGLSGLGMWRAR